MDKQCRGDGDAADAPDQQARKRRHSVYHGHAEKVSISQDAAGFVAHHALGIQDLYLATLDLK